MKHIHITMTALRAASGLALLSGCMMGTQYTPPTQQQLAAVGYGAPLTIDYKKAIQAFFFDKLKDPLSAQYLFDSQPQQRWTIDYIGGTLHVGYAMTFQMNSKNSYGGYIGFRKWLVLLRDNQIVSVTYDGNPWSQEFYTGSVWRNVVVNFLPNADVETEIVAFGRPRVVRVLQELFTYIQY